MNFITTIHHLSKENNLLFLTTQMIARLLDKDDTVVNRLVNYHQLKSIKKGVFVVGRPSEFEIAFELKKDSYVSLDTALYYYKIIPEIVRPVMSVTTGAPQKFENDFGTFTYKKIKEELFFDYQFNEGFTFRVASKEKALNDYLYFSKIRITQNIMDSIERGNYKTQGVNDIILYFQSERFQNLEEINFKKLLRNAKKMNKKNYYLCKCLEYYFQSEEYDNYK